MKNPLDLIILIKFEPFLLYKDKESKIQSSFYISFLSVQDIRPIPIF